MAKAQSTADQAGGPPDEQGYGDGVDGGQSGGDPRRDTLVDAATVAINGENDETMSEETFDERLERELFGWSLSQGMDTTALQKQEITFDLPTTTNGYPSDEMQLDTSMSMGSQAQYMQLDGTAVENTLLNDNNLNGREGGPLDSPASSQVQHGAGSHVEAVPEHRRQDAARDSALAQQMLPGNSVPVGGDHVRANSTQYAGDFTGTASTQASVIPEVSQNGVQQASVGRAQFSTAPTVPATVQPPAMPPPAAPASMLWSLRPSQRSKQPGEQIHDPSICGRLIAVTVILFRMGKANHASNLGQFTIDLIGKELWDQELPTYMNAPPLDDDNDAILPLLKGTVEILKNPERGDLVSAGFLEAIVVLMD